MEREKPGLLIKRIAHIGKRDMDNYMRDIGLTMSQGMVLEYLGWRRDTQTTQQDVEKRFELAHPTVSGLLKRLERNGFVASVQCEEDKRRKNIYLTDKALEILSVIHSRHIRFNELMTKDFSEQEKDMLYKLLIRVYENASGELGGNES